MNVTGVDEKLVEKLDENMLVYRCVLCLYCAEQRGNSSLMSAGFIWVCVFSAASVPTIHIVVLIWKATCQRPTLLRRMSGLSPCQIWKGSLVFDQKMFPLPPVLPWRMSQPVWINVSLSSQWDYGHHSFWHSGLISVGDCIYQSFRSTILWMTFQHI